MPQKSAGLISKAFAVYAKDMRLELRTRYALNAILMFGITTLAMVSFSLGQSSLAPHFLAALFWIIMFFSAMSGLAQGFVHEEETGTALALRIFADPDAIFIGKMFFNLTLMSLITIIITPLYFIFTDTPTDNILIFVVVLALGVLGLCSATTLVAAIISKASVKGALFAVLSFPILIPILFVLVSASDKVFQGLPLGELLSELQFLLAYAVVMITGSIMLFKFVWKE